jgi:MoxR-like ATPase
VLGDEINRASPKTQSALLEVMEEYQVTVDGKALAVERPFMVIATQNPVEMDGTYQLPEAQLDRFLIRTAIGYPDAAAEAEVLDDHRRGPLLEQLRPVASPEIVRAMIATAGATHLAPAVRDYIIQLAAATRQAHEIRLGASPRGSLALMRTARARAATEGRDYVLPEDVRSLVVPVLAHRLLLTADARLRGKTPEELVTDVIQQVPVPKPATTR